MDDYLIICVPYDLTVWSIPDATRCWFPRIHFFVVAGLALQLEVVRVETDLWIVAVGIVQPDPVVVYDCSWLYSAGLADPTVYRFPAGYVVRPGPLPRSGLVKLFLGQHLAGLLSLWVIQGRTRPALPAGIRKHPPPFILCPLGALSCRARIARAQGGDDLSPFLPAGAYI